MTRKTISFLLALLMCGSMFSCSTGDKKDVLNKKTPDPAASEETGAEPEQTDTEKEEDDDKTHYYSEQQGVDFEGWTLHIANDGLNPEYFSSFTVEDLTGDLFYDAVYNRQVDVETKYNIKIVEDTSGSTSLIKNCVTAGTDDVGFGYVLLRSAMGLISEDYTLPMSDLNVDFTKPYWDQGALKTLMLNDKMYYGYCDISFDHYESMALIFYNSKLLYENQITETPYDLDISGKWTLDEMGKMMSTVTTDTDGDGKMDVKKDIFGFAGREFEYLPSLYSSGARLIVYDGENETYAMNLTDDKVIAVGNKLNELLNDQNLSNLGRTDENRNLFKEGHVLFYSRLLGDFRNLRDKDDDYGIVAYPSLSEGDDRMVYVQNPFNIMVPSNCSDPERIAALIEAMAAYTYDNILHIYIENAVIGKGTRDRQSAELLRKYISMRAFDLCYAFGVSSPIDAYGTAMKKDTYASMQQRFAKNFTKSIERSMEALRGE